MQTQVRLINAQLTPELAVGLLPTKQHCLVTNAITVRGGKRPLTTTEILRLLGHKTDLVVSSNPVTAAGPKEQAALTTGAQSLAADVLPSANVLPAAPVTAAARAVHPRTGAACAASWPKRGRGHNGAYYGSDNTDPSNRAAPPGGRSGPY